MSFGPGVFFLEVELLGQISKFYFNMKQKDRQKVSETFGVMDNELEILLKYLTLFSY